MLVTQCAAHAMGEKKHLRFLLFLLVLFACVAVRKIEFNSMRKESRDDPVYCPGTYAKRFSLEGKLLLSSRLDIFAITESWLNSENNFAITEILNTLSDFTVFQIPRPGDKRGGVAIFVRKVFNITKT